MTFCAVHESLWQNSWPYMAWHGFRWNCSCHGETNQWFLITGRITCFHWHQLKKNTPNSIYFIRMGKSHSLAISLAMIRKISKVPKVNGSAMPIQWSASVSLWFKIQLMMLDKYNYMQNKLSTVYFLLLHLKNNYCFV